MSARPRGRPREFDRDEVLDRAMQVFALKGLSATSLDDLSEAMGMTRPSLYNAFGNKEGIYRHALTRFTEHLDGAIGRLVAEEPHLRRALTGFYRGALDVYFESSPPLGCFMFCTATVEIVMHPEIRGDVADVLERLDALLESKFRDAQAKGDFPDEADCAGAARVAQGVLHSIAIRARAGASRRSLERMARSAVALLCGPEGAR